mmetsp:Transcript_606/g.2477  ORF Transcript_606/g.2477 Transcript_606/m.2477 type:complete len:255 (+) Transcript_606:318-1082(+)
MVFLVLMYRGMPRWRAYSKQALAKPVMDSSVLYMAMPTPPAPSKSYTSMVCGPEPSAGVKTSCSLPGPENLASVALYWSPKAWRPITMGLVQPGTSRGTFLMRMGSRNTVPPRMLRSVPLGDFHIFLRENSVTRASSGVMVAHLMPTLCSLMASAASTVTRSSVASRFSMERSKYLTSTSTNGNTSFSLIRPQITRVISSPSSSTTDFSTAIFVKPAGAATSEEALGPKLGATPAAEAVDAAAMAAGKSLQASP